MSNFTFKVLNEHEGQTVGVFLKYTNGVSSRTIKSLKLYKGGIELNGEHIRTIDKVKAGDIVTINIEDNAKDYLLSEVQVDILYEDEDVIVFNKPPNMPCHQSKKHQQDTLANVFANIFAKRGINISYRPINRLDRDTSGAVAVAKNQYAAYHLQKQMSKIYCGVIKGNTATDSGTIEANIDRLDPIHIKRIVAQTGQYAKTDYALAKKGNVYNLYNFTLHTGRTHQIRVHMCHIGYPLAGDEMYGGDIKDIKRQALHCSTLNFVSPGSKKNVTVVAPLPNDIAYLLHI